MASEVYPGLKEFRDNGLLWLINTSCLHPRGYAMAINFDEEGNIEGWSIMGDGKESWRFGEDCDEEFNAVLALLKSAND